MFNCKNIGDYSDIYMKTDILLLADVFEHFRSNAHKTYGLDPAWYYTLPGYTWSCMLKYTQCKLDIMKDVDQLLFIESGIRGGISQCCGRFSKANNHYMTNYDPSQLSKYILYTDINNMYGHSMSDYLPYGGFEWVDTDIDVTTIPDDSEIGYILSVDILYPKSLHNAHSDFPLCPEHRVPPGSKLPKLMTTLYDKSKYIIHYRLLKQALENGLIVTKIHRVLKFKQSAWLKPYIDFNTELRQRAKSKFEETQTKLMINSIYGKTMENIRKHRIVKLVNKWGGRYGARNLIASPNFHSRMIFDENLVAIEMNKTEIVFNKPLYIGMAILDISKICLYDFHYKYMMKKFPLGSCKALYMDTDSLLYEIHCKDVYIDLIKKDSHMFDTSGYPPDNIYGIQLLNKKVPGLMKDENNGAIVTYFVGLRSKQYTFLVEGERKRCVKKSKGIKSNIIKNKIC
ncbi:unnamed protein product, partial [Callosobruchus maculatus]